MIHTLLGEENFQKGMQLYFSVMMVAQRPVTILCRRWKMRRMSISPISTVGTASPVRRL
ncbi:hypothetical protein ACLB1N_05410 [Escherichia coli]